MMLEVVLLFHLIFAGALTPLAYLVARHHDDDRHRTVFNVARIVACVGALRVAVLLTLLVLPELLATGEMLQLAAFAAMDTTWTLGWLMFTILEFRWRMLGAPADESQEGPTRLRRVG